MGLNKEGSYSCLTPTLILKHSFHTLSLTLLTLLLPLSFLLQAKLTSSSPSSSIPQLSSTILRFLISFLSICCLLYSFTGHVPKPGTPVAWAFLCTFQVCITLGIEVTIATGNKPRVPSEISHIVRIERVAFFLGLYETMLHWMRMFVKQVVDDTIYGVEVEEGKVNRAAIGVAFAGLWLWMLQDEVEPLVFAAGKGGLFDGMEGWNGFVLWLVSHTTVVIGMVRVVEVVFWVGSHLFLYRCCRGDADEALICCATSTDEV